MSSNGIVNSPHTEDWKTWTRRSRGIPSAVIAFLVVIAPLVALFPSGRAESDTRIPDSVPSVPPESRGPPGGVASSYLDVAGFHFDPLVESPFHAPGLPPGPHPPAGPGHPPVPFTRPPPD